MKNLSYLILFLCALMSSCSKDTEQEANMEDKMLELVNKYRQEGCQCGSKYYPPVPPLKWNDLLAKSAQNHSNDMVEKRYFSHTSPNGTTVGQRLRAVGYSFTTWGENIASGHSTAESAVKSWIKSPGHCANIMSPRFKEMGAGTKKGYWTQVFATSNVDNK